ncbi:PfkB family carbohydrate kinase [Acidimicrobiaceae bacterium]|nr:PfkB family carbohydrate kinase [Acidimicrobiaceae bacterium]
MTDKILVIGDFCIDRFVYGSSKRINPEVPVPIFNPINIVENYGMSGNVAENLSSLGFEIDLICNKNKIVKTRYVDIESNHMHLRVDENDSVDEKESFKGINEIDFDQYSSIVITDHNKGFLSKEDIKNISTKNKLVFLQTSKLIDIWAESVSYIKLNMKEYLLSKDKIYEMNFLNKLIITDGSNGCFYNEIHFPIEKNIVTRDLSGAGDTFLSVFVKSILEKLDVETSISNAQQAAIEIVQKRGVAKIGENEGSINFL